MTFCSKSNDFELPRVGEVWLELGKASYREGETPAKQRLWLVLSETHPVREGSPTQFTILNIETGRERRINGGKFISRKHPWKRFASPKS